MNLGTLWWTADSPQEALEWVRIYLERGAVSVKVDAPRDANRLDVFIELDKARAQEILDYVPDEEEWLVPEDPR